jgi:hypothetical protein
MIYPFENGRRAWLARDAGYFHSNVNQAVGITVKDWQSGKTIAEYSVFSGVTIK